MKLTKSAALILGVTTLLLFAGAADAKKAVSTEAPIAHQDPKKGGICVLRAQTLSDKGRWFFDCDNIGEHLEVADIYGRGWRIVSTFVNHDYREILTLFIEEQ